MRRFRITVEGVAYEVAVEELDQPTAPRPLPINTAASTAAPAVGEHTRAARPERAEARPATPGDVISPLAGVIVSVGVAVGDRVEAEQPLLVLEAMKMQTTIVAPHAGVVSAINVAAGVSVQEGQVLMGLS